MPQRFLAFCIECHLLTVHILLVVSPIVASAGNVMVRSPPWLQQIYRAEGGMRKPAPSHLQPTAKRSRLSQPNREIAGKELEPQPSGNEREANSDGRKEAMCAVVQSIVIIAQR